MSISFVSHKHKKNTVILPDYFHISFKIIAKIKDFYL